MDDEIYEEIVSEGPEETPVSEDVSAPEVSPEPVEADAAVDPAPAPALDPAPEPVGSPAPVEVITVDDFLGRLTSESQEVGEAEEPLPVEEQPMDAAPESDLPDAQVDGGPIEVVGMDKVLTYLETIQQQTENHPMMTTPFEDYTVTEGLLLLVFVILLLDFFLNILRRWF